MDTSAPERLLAQWLDNRGLLLCAFRWETLPDALRNLTLQAMPAKIADEVEGSTSVVLLANAGPKFWHHLKQSPLQHQENPVDAVSIDMAHTLNQDFLNAAPFTQLYPSPPNHSFIPLMRFGGLAGWNVPSPLGLGLHPDYGPWSAYRAAWLSPTDQVPNAYCIQPENFKSTDTSTLQNSAALCIGCSAPCVTACPAGAVIAGQNFGAARCHEYRLPESSPCHTHCDARRACPIGADQQYDDEQLEYHMGMRWKYS